MAVRDVTLALSVTVVFAASVAVATHRYVGNLNGTATAAADRASLPILVYHQLRVSGDEPADSDEVISLDRFESQMRTLHDLGYRTLSMDEVTRFLRGESFPPKIVAIHLDDGWKSGLAAVPVLNRFDFHASFWIIAGTGISWPHLDWPEVEALASNPRFDVLSHTMTHPWKPNDTMLDWLAGRTPGKGLEQARAELTQSRRVLEDKLGRPVLSLAWPSGLYNEPLIALAQDAGYQALLTIDSGLNAPGDDLLRIRRTMIHGACNLDVFQQMLLDGRSRNCDAVPTPH